MGDHNQKDKSKNKYCMEKIFSHLRPLWFRHLNSESESPSTFLFSHKDNFQKIIESFVINPLHHVDLLGDHSETEHVEILKNPQMIDIINGKSS